MAQKVAFFAPVIPITRALHRQLRLLRTCHRHAAGLTDIILV
jgi:hypothetical protein